MSLIVNRAGMTTATTGTGTVTLGAAITDATNGDYLSFLDAGVTNAAVIKYLITDGNNFELGQGTYTTTGTTLSRDTVTKSKSGATVGTALLSLSGSAKVYIVPHAEDEQLITRKSDGAACLGNVDSSGGPLVFYGYEFRHIAKWGTGHTQYDWFASYGVNVKLTSGSLVHWVDTGDLSTGSIDVGFKRDAVGRVLVFDGSIATNLRDMRMRSIVLTPPASVTPANNGELMVQATSNTQITFKLKGSDGTVRSGSITLA
jgi:hypothetical protein